MTKTLRNTIVSGLLTTTATSLALIIANPRKATASFNAVSHIAFGDDAFRHEERSAKYTATGFLLNTLAVGSWSLVHELILPRTKRVTPLAAVVSGAAVSTLAYVVDYHVVPERLKPGFERKISKPALTGVYALLAIGLTAAALLRE